MKLTGACFFVNAKSCTNDLGSGDSRRGPAPLAIAGFVPPAHHRSLRPGSCKFVHPARLSPRQAATKLSRCHRPAPHTAAAAHSLPRPAGDITCYCPQWPAVAHRALCQPPAAPPCGWRQHTLCKVAGDELLAHRLMFLVSALSRSSWAPHNGLRRFAAAPGLLLALVVIELVLVALHQIGMAAKITLALVATRRLHGTKPGTSGYAVATRTPKRKGLLLFS